ncbi:MAG: hypothetical protein WCW03_02810 [Candidatus Paceibacterota bacterium]|jgi:hypothetical protein
MSSEVEFEEDKIDYGRPRSSSGQNNHYMKPGFNKEQSKMSQWLIDHGIAGTPVVAQAILIGLVIVNIVITYIVVKYML